MNFPFSSVVRRAVRVQKLAPWDTSPLTMVLSGNPSNQG